MKKTILTIVIAFLTLASFGQKYSISIEDGDSILVRLTPTNHIIDEYRVQNHYIKESFDLDTVFIKSIERRSNVNLTDSVMWNGNKYSVDSLINSIYTPQVNSKLRSIMLRSRTKERRGK
jgi:hypothetical protein